MPERAGAQTALIYRRPKIAVHPDCIETVCKAVGLREETVGPGAASLV
jgi:hypothetical protein